LFISSFDVRSAFYEQQQRQVVVVVELNSKEKKWGREGFDFCVSARIYKVVRVLTLNGIHFNSLLSNCV